jgi:hypothetical protein
MNRRGLIPPKPPSLRGVPTKIDFISMLTQAQRATATQAIARTVQFGGVMAGTYPETRFDIDPSAALREFGQGVGASTKIFRSPAQAKRLAAQSAAQVAQQAALAQTVAGSQAAGALAKTSLAPGNALSALVGGGGAAPG